MGSQHDGVRVMRAYWKPQMLPFYKGSTRDESRRLSRYIAVHAMRSWGMTYRAIGSLVGLSVERTRQIDLEGEREMERWASPEWKLLDVIWRTGG